MRASATGQCFRDGSYGTRRRRRAHAPRLLSRFLSLPLVLFYVTPLPPRAIPRRGSFLDPVFSRHSTPVHVARALDRPPTMCLTRATVRWADDDDVALLDLRPSGCVCVSLSPSLLRNSRAAILALLRLSRLLARARERRLSSLRLSLSLTCSLFLSCSFFLSRKVFPPVPLRRTTLRASSLRLFHYSSPIPGRVPRCISPRCCRTRLHNHEMRRRSRDRTLSFSLYVVVVVSVLDSARTQQKVILLVVAVVAVVAVAAVLVVVV